MKRGCFITFEGVEGSGKSTQIKLLARALRRAGRRVVLTREPGGTAVSDAIRAVLLNRKHTRMTALCETLLYMASRAQLVEEVIRPKLKTGFVVLCDRWLDATLAYQGYAGGMDVGWIQSLGKKVTGGLEPDLTLLLDLPVGHGLRRSKSHKPADRMERKGLAYHRKVRAGYLLLARANPRRIHRIPVFPDDSIPTLHQKIRRLVDQILI